MQRCMEYYMVYREYPVVTRYHVLACIWWHETHDLMIWSTRYVLIMVPTNTSTTAYPYKGNHKDPPLQVFGYYVVCRGYPVDTRYHDIACIWWHENTWFDVLRLHDYGDIQYITRSLRHHGDHYICYKEYTCSAWYLYHRVGDMPTIPMETTSSRYMVCAQRMVPWYEVPQMGRNTCFRGTKTCVASRYRHGISTSRALWNLRRSPPQGMSLRASWATERPTCSTPYPLRDHYGGYWTGPETPKMSDLGCSKPSILVVLACKKGRKHLF